MNDKIEYMKGCVRKAKVARKGHNRELALEWVTKIKSLRAGIPNDIQERRDNHKRMMEYLKEHNE